MKRNLFFLFLLAFMTIATVLQAQAPQAVTLQSVLRDAAGRLVANRNVGVQITLRQGSAMGSIVYQETHTPTTNQNGLYTVFFGQGTPTSGTFAGIDWASGPYYATVAADPNGGNNYTLTVNHPIVSVPYALYAEQAKEMQVLAYSNDTLYLRGGNTTTWVYLPAGGGGGGGFAGCVPSCGRVDTIEHKLDSIISLSCIATVHYEARSECDNYTWPVNAQTYEVSGTYTYTRARGNVRGCDSIEMLMLTINRSTHNVENQVVTGFINWHNIARANTGTYTYEYTNGFGCASVDTLKLKVNTPGTLPGEFTVNSSGKKVKFSRGNLQFQASSGNWRFAEHQYDAIRNYCGNTSANNSGNSCWMDLFGWGTSGHPLQADANNQRYRPWNVDAPAINGTYNYYGYGPSTNIGSGDLTGAGDILDWGVSNAIANGGSQIGKWRVLTAEEWQYLFENTSRTNLRYCFARIQHVMWIAGDGSVINADANVNGIIIFPDTYVHPTSEGVADIQQPNNRGRLFGDNVISAFGWSAMEAAGAVFLPAGGVREGNDVYQWNAGVDCTDNNCEVNQNNWGRYWSSTHATQYCSRILWFYNGHLWPNYSRHEDEGYYWDGEAQWQYYLYHYRFNTYRYRGYSVRLVQDIN